MNEPQLIREYLARFRTAMIHTTRFSSRAYEEIRHHLIESTARHRREGLALTDAQRKAIAELGTPEALSEGFLRIGGPLMSFRDSRWLKVLSALLVLPGALFVISSLLKYEFGAEELYDGFFASAFDHQSDFVEPILNIIFVMGPVLALVFVALATVRIGGKTEDGSYLATVSIQLTRGSLAVAISAIVVLGAIGAYLLLENLPCLMGGRVTC